MKLYRTTTALAIGIAAVASPAIAQDGSARDTHFDGPYISGALGWGMHTNDGTDRLVFDTDRDGVYDDTVTTTTGANAFSPGFCGGQARGATRGEGCAKDSDKLEYALRLGYDARMNNLVVGGLIEASRNESTDVTSGFSSTPASYALRRSLDYAISARARAGFTPGGGALFYVTGGGSYAKIDHKFYTTNAANSFDEVRDGKMVWGWQAGGGSEIMLTDKVSLGIEYLFSKYKDNKYRVEVGQGTAPATNPFLLASGGTDIRPSDRTFELHSVRATVGYRF